MDAETLFLSNLALIDRVVGFVCRKYRIEGADAEDLSSTVRVRLLENDYAVLRKYAGRSSLSTYLNVVVQRIALDVRVQQWGKWRPSAEARRGGELMMKIESMILRDGRSRDAAFDSLRSAGETCTRATFDEIADRLTPRTPRPVEVSLDHAAHAIASNHPSDVRTVRRERDAVASRVNETLSGALSHLRGEDRLVLRMRFADDCTVAEIARTLHLDQKQLYKRIETLIVELRKALIASGLSSHAVAELVQEGSDALHFVREDAPARTSMDRTPATGIDNGARE